MESYAVLLAGRVVFGFGAENIGVVQSKVICKWFKNDEIAFTIALSTAFSRAGSLSNSYVTPKITTNLGFPLLIGDLACIFSLLCGMVLVYMDYRADKVEGGSEHDEASERVRWKDVKKLSKIYWMLTMNAMFTYGSLQGFTNVGNDYIVTSYGFSKSDAGDILSVYYAISTLGTPVIGYLIDKFGKRTQLIIGSLVLLMAAYVILIIYPTCDQCYVVMLPICLMGVFIAIYAAVYWASVPITCDARVLGTAFGLTYSFQNLSETISPLVVGKLQDYGYNYVAMYLLGVAVIAVFTAFMAKIYDSKGEKCLEKVY
jgi:nitrate/nitrite transporter NarK